ncbi:inactive tyrosine-protein kinase 7-like [Copidosoma floridanum]|uniref:inactive tyrosine-protein kinase 7-like n=1 Tax=Copidosoma floridanum TaxID=29053 RepID=UPI0006C94BBF|nr:inactive tyrosine-protein kinase 7-like [Copidosoma floridanum]
MASRRDDHSFGGRLVLPALGFFLLLSCCCQTASSHRRREQAEQQPGRLYFTVSPSDHTVVEGLPVTLRCKAEPRGLVTYAWKMEPEKQTLAPSPRRHVVPEGDLVITRVDRLLDSGNFVCVATRPAEDEDAGDDVIESSPAKIDVQWISEASVQLQQPKPTPLIQPGGKVELRCQVDGSGELKYEWFRNTKRIVPSDRVKLKHHQLVINEASPEDNGVYRCMGRNAAGASPMAHSFPLVVPSNETATIRVVPQKTIVRRGETASFGCAYDNADAIQWFHEDRGPLESDDERTILDNGTLLVVQPEDRDRGFYSCHGIKGDTVQSYAAELQIAYIKNLSVASFEPALPDQVAVVGENQELQVSCLAPAGLPPPKLYWRDPQGRIISDAGPVRVQDGTLIVAKARRPADQGNYTCVAENLAGTTRMAVQVVVSYPAKLVSPPRSVVAMEDQPAQLSCSYRGMEPPISQTRWLKDGELLRETGAGGPARYRLHEQPGNATLVFKNVQLSDAGNYACEVITRGQPPLRSQPANLSVRETLKFTPKPVDKRFELNSNTKVSCKAQGSSPLSFKWHKNGTDHFPKHVHEANGTLHFNGVQEVDKGYYTCVASSNQGQINHTIKIDVFIAPKFTVRPENLTANEGSAVMLHCAAEGDPKPAIHWDKDSRMNNLNGDRFVLVDNGSLFIKEVYLTDEGKYGCTAGNSGGFKRTEMHLTVRAVEGYRSDMELDITDDGSMMTKTVIITLGVATAYMMLVIGLMLYCRYRRRRRKQRDLQEQVDGQEKGETGEVQEEQCELRETSGVKLQANSTSSGGKRRENRESHRSDGTDTAYSQASNHSKRSKSSYDKLAISRSQLAELKPLGRGEFGEIFSTKFLHRPANDDESSSSSGSREIIVMVKTLNNTKDESILQEFKRHLDLLYKLNHENITRLVGLCRDEEPDYMVIEYTDWGDLKQFLLASKSTKELTEAGKPRAPQLTVAQIVSLANQAARGLKHISDHRLVHKDVAARNCLISSNLNLKLSLSCMSKEPFQQEYTRHKNQVIPLRWMPKEAVFEDEYSSKSDVYSYACLVWEIFHQGELPFKKLNDDAVLAQIKSQTLSWTAHKAAPTAMQELQTECWSYDPRERPTFDQVVAKLQDIVVDCSQV